MLYAVRPKYKTIKCQEQGNKEGSQGSHPKTMVTSTTTVF